MTSESRPTLLKGAGSEPVLVFLLEQIISERKVLKARQLVGSRLTGLAREKNESPEKRIGDVVTGFTPTCRPGRQFEGRALVFVQVEFRVL